MVQALIRESPLRTNAVCRLMLLTLLPLLLAGCGPTLTTATRPTFTYDGQSSPGEGATRFVVFDVGQADCMLVINDGRTMLVDAGVSRSREDRDAMGAVARRIESLTGRRHLDYLVVTHYHADHIGTHQARGKNERRDQGLWELLDHENFTIDTLVDRGSFTYVFKGGTQKKFETSVSRWLRDGLIRTRRLARTGDTIDLGKDLRIEVVAVNGNDVLASSRARDPAMFEKWPPSENDYAIALKFTKGDFEFFTAGDLSGRYVYKTFGPITMSYNDIESVIAEAIGDIEVYRVNHHGSDNSTNPCFLSVLHPEVSIFSTGDNSYGHPAPRVYQATRATGDVWITGGGDPALLPMLRQDVVDGDIEVMVASDGRRYWVNGKAYESRTDAEEASRPDAVLRCQAPTKPEAAPDNKDTDSD